MSNQTKRNKKIAVVSVSAAMVATAVTPTGVSAFSDVGSSYKNGVNYLKSKGVQGYSSKKFGVYDKIKRVDAAIMFAKVLGLNIYAAPPSGFTDVPARAVPYVNVLKAVGIVSGISKTKFNSNSYISRGEIALMIQRAYNLQGSNNLPFTDVSPFFSSAVSALYDYGITQGVSSTRYGTALPIQRGDFANLLYRTSKVAVYDPNNPNNPNQPSKFGISSAKYISKTEVEVKFSQAIDGAKLHQFVIDGLKISSAKLASDKRTVTLKVDPMEYGKTYNVSAEGITINKEVQSTVRASFKSEATPAALAVSSIRMINATEIEVTLSKSVDSVKANNFQIDGVNVRSAKLNTDKRKVTLTLENLQYNKSYKLNIDGLMINKELQPAFSANFTTTTMPDGAKITNVKFISLTEMEVTFAKPVDSIKNTNFIIDNVKVKGVKLSSDRLKATVNVEVLQYSKSYRLNSDGLTINKVKQAPSSYSFTTPTAPPGPQIINYKVLNMNEVELTFSQDIDPVKVTNFSIEDVKVKSAKSTSKRTVLLTLDGLNYNMTYPVKADGITVNKIKQPLISGEFKTPAAPASAQLKILDAQMIRSNEVELRFDKSIDTVNAANFDIPGQVIKSAKLQTDKRKVVVMTLDPLEYGGKSYTIQALGIKVNKILQSSPIYPFTSPSEPEGGFLKVNDVKYITQNSVEVLLSTEVDSVKTTNFKLDNGKKVTGAKLASDKRTVTLTVSALDYDADYTLTVEGVQVNKDTHPTITKEFKTPAINEVWEVRVSAKEAKRLQDGSTEREVVFELMNRITKTVDTKANGIVLELNSSIGSFDKRQVTLTKGVGSAMLTSHPLSKDETSIVTAKIIDAPLAYDMLIDQVKTYELPLYSTIDGTPFSVVGVKGAKGSADASGYISDTITITFSEGVNYTQATNLANFRLNGKPFVPPNSDPSSPTYNDFIPGATIALDDNDNNTDNGLEIIKITILNNSPDLTKHLKQGINIIEINPEMVSKDNTLFTGESIQYFTTEFNEANKLNEVGIHTFNSPLRVNTIGQFVTYGPSVGGISEIQGADVYISSAEKLKTITIRNLTFYKKLIVDALVEMFRIEKNVNNHDVMVFDKSNTDFSSSIINESKLQKVKIKDAQEGVTFSNSGDGSVEEVIIDTTAPVTLEGNFDKVIIENQKANVIIRGDVKYLENNVDGSSVEVNTGTVDQVIANENTIIGGIKPVKEVTISRDADVTVRTTIDQVNAYADSSIVLEEKGIISLLDIRRNTKISGKGIVTNARVAGNNTTVTILSKIDNVVTDAITTLEIGENGRINELLAKQETTLTGYNGNWGTINSVKETVRGYVKDPNNKFEDAELVNP